MFLFTWRRELLICAICCYNISVAPHTLVLAAHFTYLGSLVHLKKDVADVDAPVKRIGLTVRHTDRIAYL